MSLTIDYVTMPPKSQEISQIQHGEQVKQDQAQQEVASQFQQQVEQNTYQTIRRARTENEEYKYDEKDREGKGKRGSGGRRDKKQGREQERKNLKPGPGESSFDIMI